MHVNTARHGRARLGCHSSGDTVEHGLTSSSLTVACPNVLAAFLGRPPCLTDDSTDDTHTAHPGRGFRVSRSKHRTTSVPKGMKVFVLGMREASSLACRPDGWTALPPTFHAGGPAVDRTEEGRGGL